MTETKPAAENAADDGAAGDAAAGADMKKAKAFSQEEVDAIVKKRLEGTVPASEHKKLRSEYEMSKLSEVNMIKEPKKSSQNDPVVSFGNVNKTCIETFY